MAVLFVDGRKKKKVGEEETIRLSEFELSWSAASFLFFFCFLDSPDLWGKHSSL